MTNQNETLSKPLGTAKEYWKTLTDAQKAKFHNAVHKADELGYELVVEDAYDLWAAVVE